MPPQQRPVVRTMPSKTRPEPEPVDPPHGTLANARRLRAAEKWLYEPERPEDRKALQVAQPATDAALDAYLAATTRENLAALERCWRAEERALEALGVDSELARHPYERLSACRPIRESTDRQIREMFGMWRRDALGGAEL